MAAAGELRPFEVILFDGGSTLFYFAGNPVEVLRQGVKELSAILADAVLAAAVLASAASQLDKEASAERFAQQFAEQFAEQFAKRFGDELLRYYREREMEFIEYTTEYLLQGVLAEFGEQDIPAEVQRQAIDAMYRVTQAYWHAEDDAIPTLELLRAQGYRLGLVSNASDEQDVQTLIDQTGLRPYFEVVLISAALGIRKPNPKIFHAALEHWGIPPGEAAMVGDTLGADVLGAQNAGLYSIWITRRADTPANRAHAGTIVPEATIGRLSELPQLLENISHALF